MRTNQVFLYACALLIPTEGSAARCVVDLAKLNLPDVTPIVGKP